MGSAGSRPRWPLSLAVIVLAGLPSASACAKREAEPAATPTTAGPTETATAPGATITRTPSPTRTPLSPTPRPAPTPTPTPVPHIRYNVDPAVPVREGSLVELGITMAEEFSAENLGGAVQRQILVIVTTEALCIHGAVTVGYEVCINVGNKNWQAIPADYLKIKIAAHEYFHVWQHELRCYREPKWLFEGAPEYLAYEAITGQSLVDPVAASVAQQLVLKEASPLPALSQFEVAYSAPTEAHYALWYFAVQQLMQGHEPLALRDFCRMDHEGGDWQSAFAEVFGESPAAFYERFAAWRTEFLQEPASP